MSDPSRLLASLLSPAVDAARAALRRLEPDEVPASLRRVAAYAGGRLPPPLLRSLLEELDASDWLRKKAVPELADGPGSDAGRLYLERPNGWALELAEAAGAHAAAAADRERIAAEQRAAAAEDRLATTKRRLRDAKSPPAPKAEPAVDDLRRKLKEVRLESDKAQAALEERLAAATAAAGSAAEAARAEAEEARRLRSRLRRARRDRARLEAELQSRAGGSAGRWDPVELARRLDHTARLARPSPHGAALEGEEPPLAMELPAGVRPDAAAAIDWLVGLETPAQVLVDGYNVTYALSERGFATPEARSRLDAALGRLATLGPALRVVVVYDSGRDGEPNVKAGPGGIEVVFAAADQLADEELIARAAAASLPAVVVSTDREVREGAEAVGALALWGEALVGWIRRRS